MEIDLLQQQIDSYTRAFDELYKELCYIALSYVHDDFLAQDLVSDVFKKLWEQKFDLAGLKSIKAFLVTAVQNKCISYLRTNGQKREQELPISDDEPSHQDKLIQAELMRRLSDLIETLPGELPIVLKAYYYDGKKPKEIAEELQITLRAYYKLREKGLRLLLKKLRNKDPRVYIYLTILLSNSYKN